MYFLKHKPPRLHPKLQVKGYRKPDHGDAFAIKKWWRALWWSNVKLQELSLSKPLLLGSE